MSAPMSRRELLAAGGAAVGAGLAASLPSAEAAPGRTAAEPFGYCFNTSTIRGQKIGIVEEIEIAARAGFQAIEPWINEIDQYVKEGGTLKDLGKRISDAGLTVESAIGFAQWIVDDDEKRKAGLEESRRCLDIVQQIGGKRLAAPPAGMTDRPGLDLFQAAERYRALLELGDQFGVVPELELWGFSKNLSRLGEVAFVSVEAGHPRACVLLDVYHIHKGGSDMDGLRIFNGAAIPVLHVNDYPADPAREQITDAHRVYPGDGVAPLTQVFRILRDIGFRGYLSLELFNRSYWEQDAYAVARIGLDKTRQAVAKAFA